MQLVESLSSESQKTPDEAPVQESDFSTDFSNLNEDLQSQIRDYQTKGWTITKSPEGYNAEVFYGLKPEKTVIPEIQSIDALFAAIEAEEKEYQKLIADQESVEEKFEKEGIKENSYLKATSNEFLKRLQLLESNAKTVTREVYVRLTDAELLAYQEEENEIDAQLERIILEAKVFTEQVKTRKAENAKDKARVVNARRTKEEKREIECYEDFDYVNRVVKFIRKDNFQDAGSRPMNDKERQRYLPLI